MQLHLRSILLVIIKRKPVGLAAMIAVLLTLLGTGGSFAFQAGQIPVYLPLVVRDYLAVFTNPGFEQGSTGWVIQSNQGDEVVTLAAAHGGVRSAALGNGSANRLTSIAQVVKVPQEAYTLGYFQWWQSLEACPGANRLMVYVNDQPYQHYKICADGGQAAWIANHIYLAPYKGQSVEVKFEFDSSEVAGNYLYLDDFSFGIP